MEIKDIIKNRRIELHLTLEDVAKCVRVSPATVSRWESGDIANMRRDKIALLSSVLQINPMVLMGWEDENGLKIPLQIIDSNTDEEELPVLDDPEIRALARKDNFKSNPEKTKKLKQLIKIMLENDGDD
ncbi:helix-turn-helix domain-containing protein [Dialister invisus]|uniref:helix-turn-helix domain-containing protein n=1 Tax=Dialister invisus TaxID=218538 RepID=UPI0023F4530F|nr:helix-turn-helix domain-containing protein [Dialister invisus]